MPELKEALQELAAKRIKQLEDWKESALQSFRDWDMVATELGYPELAELGGKIQDYCVARIRKEREELRITKEDNLVLKEQVRYWKWRVVGKEDVEPGEEYLIEER